MIYKEKGKSHINYGVWILSLAVITTVYVMSPSEIFAKYSRKTRKGDNVSVHYVGKFKDGKVFDSSRGRGPLKFTVGAGQMIKGFDKAVVGMKVGEKKTVTLPPEEAYGPLTLPPYTRNKLPEELRNIRKKGKVTVTNSAGKSYQVWIMDFNEKTVTFKNPHPMAGKTLIFEIELVSLR